MTWIKICGTTNLEDALAAVEAGADALGFVFAESPRRVVPAQVAEIVRELPPQVEKIGVFVDDTPSEIRDIAERVGLTGVQLHSASSAASAGGLELHEWTKRRGLRLILLTLPLVAADGSIERLPAPPPAELAGTTLLLDSSTPSKPGGTGVPFDWYGSEELVRSMRGLVELVVAGGLRPDNVGEAIRRLRPFGIDVVSGVEARPGKKDPDKLRAFIAAVRAADAEIKAKEHATTP